MQFRSIMVLASFLMVSGGSMFGADGQEPVEARAKGYTGKRKRTQELILDEVNRLLIEEEMNAQQGPNPADINAGKKSCTIEEALALYIKMYQQDSE